jgi:inhibitor of KinA
MKKELLLVDGYEVRFEIIEAGYALLSWPAKIDLDVNASVVRLNNLLSNKLTIIDLVPAYASIGIFYDPQSLKIEEILYALELEMDPKSIEKTQQQIHKIPVCYDLEFGLDIQKMCDYKGISYEKLIELHTSPVYRIYFTGFLPGFLYMGGLNESLYMDRRSEPRLRIAAGSVGIGGTQTGIYPLDSPGGWNIIGRCPVKLFDIGRTEPCRFSGGMDVQFSAITISEFWNKYNLEYP